ncbi:MAG: phenylalanine--tRNA ligase subunit beta, partial [Candidatus Ancillula sp.]|nr:phenylalanine--tRNA ligase subunit beta [Candidatus Ancillula sp.]
VLDSENPDRITKEKYKNAIQGLKFGDDLKDVLGLGQELLEINITPDRGYCFSMRGIAREYSHSTGNKFTDLVLDYADKAAGITQNDNGDCLLNDENPIHNVIGCPKYATIKIENVDVLAPTPDWMKRRIESEGVRSISLPVDVTNYIMLHFGQPLHAYDLDQINFPIVVRRAKPGEKIQTLDGKERELFDEDLLITDSLGGEGKRPIGVAGVMGGFETEVTDKTKNILLESAYFETVTIARSARKHKLPSEASKRFERGIDPTMQEAAILYAAELLVEYGGGRIMAEADSPIHVATIGEKSAFQPIVIDFNYNEVERLLGVTVSDQKITEILKQIGCDVQESSHDSRTSAKVIPPAWRPDLTITPDLVEEVARLYGYDQIPSILPKAVHNSAKALTKTIKDIERRKIISDALAARGFVEVLSYPFVGEETFKKLNCGEDCDRHKPFVIKNPLAGDRPYLRTGLLQTTLDVASLNYRRGNQDFSIFEIGMIYLPKKEVTLGKVEIPTLPGGEMPNKKDLGMIARSLPKQPHCLAGVITGVDHQKKWSDSITNSPTDELNWAKAIQNANVVLLLSGLDKKAKITFSQNPNEIIKSHAFHQGRVGHILVNGEKVGVAGELDQKVCKAYDLPERTSAFEINLDSLAKFKSIKPFTAQTISTYPKASEDYAFVVSKDTSVTEAIEQIKESIIKNSKVQNVVVDDVHLFDVFSDEGKIGNNKKSLSFSVSFRGLDRTLSNKEINTIREDIISGIKQIGGELRS